MPETSGRKGVVITGATGFLGSHLLVALLGRGYDVIVFGRAARGEPLASRIARTLAWFGAGICQPETVEADLLQPRLGLDRSHYDRLSQMVWQIVHCASDTRFAMQNRPQSLATNVHSLNELLAFASHSKASCFHYVSTAYAAGIDATVCPEAPVQGKTFANAYEETKAMAETAISAHCRRSSLPFTIIRPSIVYGHSSSGRANRFTALYHHVRALWHLRQLYLSDIQCHGGQRSQQAGIGPDNHGRLHLPIRIVLPHQGNINLIPIDYFVAATIAILERGERWQIYHLTSDHPAKVEEIAGYCERFLKLSGLQVIYGKCPAEPSANAAEQLFNRFLEPYRPYLADRRVFQRLNTDRITGISPPRFSYDIFQRCMGYAAGVQWQEQ